MASTSNTSEAKSLSTVPSRRKPAKSDDGKVRRSKVRTGCRTCKVRRLKCDEARPACGRCTSTGRLCDGYGALAIASLPFDIQGTSEERRGYHYFRLQTATAILGSQDASYWTDCLFQLSYQQPAIKHALIAMASMHEALETTDWYMNARDNDKGLKLRMFSWKQYNHAIRSILRETTEHKMPIEILIILCLLFNQYDNFQCDYAAAYMHIKSGLKLIEQWSEQVNKSSISSSNVTATTADMIRDHVAPMLTRLDVQAAFLMHSDAFSPAYEELTERSPPAIPEMFESFSQARQAFDHAASWMFHVLGRKPEASEFKAKEKCVALYERWWTAFGALIGRSPVRLGSDDDRAARLLRVYYNFARIVLDTHHDKDEMGFDQQTERFDVMVQQAQDLVQLPYSGEKPGQPFSFDISLASPLNYVALRCRYHHIRRQAITMLKAAVKTSWNCEHCALEAQYMMETEERALGTITTCKDIPSEQRIRRVTAEICFDEGHIKLSYVRYPYTADTAVHTAILPLLDSAPEVVTTKGSIEMPPVVLGQQESVSTSETVESQTQTGDTESDHTRCSEEAKAQCHVEEGSLEEDA